MSRKENILKLQQKGEVMISFFDKDFPNIKFQLNNHTLILDLNFFVKKQIETMRNYHGNPYSKNYISSYLLLNELKNKLNEKVS